MKRLLLSLAAAAALIAPSAVAASDTPIYGVWVRDGHPTDKLEFYDCAGKLCAKGTQPMLDGSPAPEILRKAAKTGPNNWKGDLFNPEDGKTYTGKIAYEPPNQFTLTGCLVAFLCQSETWTRVSGPPKPAAPKPEAKSDAEADKHADKTAAKAAGATDTAHAAKPAKPAADAKPAAKPAPAKPKADDDDAN